MEKSQRMKRAGNLLVCKYVLNGDNNNGIRAYSVGCLRCEHGLVTKTPNFRRTLVNESSDMHSRLRKNA